MDVEEVDIIDADQPSTLKVNEGLKAGDEGHSEGQSQEQKEVNSRLEHHDQVHGHPADPDQVHNRLANHDQTQNCLGDHDQVQDRLDDQFHQEEMSEGSEVVSHQV